MKKILITGSAGFIFGNFIRKAIYDQNQITNKKYVFSSIDRINSNALNSMYWNKSHTFYPADIRDQHVIDIIFQYERPDIVIHGAASTHVDTSMTDPNDFVTNNILGTQVIVNSCLKYSVERLIHISTDEVYGQLNETDLPWKETSPLSPRNPYAASKASAELMVKAAHETHGLIYNITRSSNCYGPRQLPEKLIPKAIKSILENKKIPIYGKGLQMRDWTHVFDNCAGIMTVLEKGEPNEIYNISANQEFTNLEVIYEICKSMEASPDIIDFVVDPRGNGHDFRYAIDSSKIKELGWKPQIKFKDGVQSTCQWFNDNKWFIK